jgi:hypothetical protein
MSEKLTKMQRIVEAVAESYGLSPFVKTAINKLYSDPARALALYDRIERIIKE